MPDLDVHALGPALIAAAAAELGNRVYRTPALRIPALDDLAGTELWLKCENLQRLGVFKVRGALLAVGRLSPRERARGVVTYSSGNHAQAVALAAREYGISATIAMPTDAPAIKVDGVRRLGAEIVLAGTTSAERQHAALEICARTHATLIEPFDDLNVIAGQGTATRELVAQVAEATDGGMLDAVLVPVGGGGLIAGACLALRGSATQVFSAEPYGCDALARSLEAGERVDVLPAPTLADGLKPVRVGALNYAIARTDVAASFRVDDDAIGGALVRLLICGKVLVEPSGAAGLAVALGRQLPANLRRVGVLLSGGNVEPRLVARLLHAHETSS